MGRVGVGWMSTMGVFPAGCALFRSDDIDFGCDETAAAYLAHFKAGTHIECDGGFRKGIEGDAGVHQGAEHHVAAYTGKTLKIGSSHRG